MNEAEKQAIADAAKLMLEQLRSDRGKTSYWGRRWLDNHADDDIEVWLESVLEVFGAPPIKVGDLVTAENIGQLPEWSIVAMPGCGARCKTGGTWRLEDNQPLSDNQFARYRGIVVLRIGGGS